MSCYQKMSYLCSIMSLVIVSSCLLQLATAEDCFLSGAYYFAIVNNVLPVSETPLLVHCASRNNDLGNHTLHYQDYVQWQFCLQIFHRTLFHCRVSWGSRSLSFDAFNNHIRKHCSYCLWQAQSDGIYFQKQAHPEIFNRVYSW